LKARGRRRRKYGKGGKKIRFFRKK